LNKRNVALEHYLLSAGGTRRHLVKHLYIPALIPTFQSNLSLGFGLALKVVVLGEFIGAQEGVGYLLNVAAIHFDMKTVLFYLAVVLLLSALFETAQNFVFTVFLDKYFYPE
jgi:NitT/TauT family transport system permease protein